MATHGITFTEVATGARPAASTNAVAVYVGTAPLVDETAVNVPRKYESLGDFEADMGYISPPEDWGNWTLHEAAHAHFSVYGVGPIVCINVIDPDNASHISSATSETHVFDADGEVQIGIYGGAEPQQGVIASTVIVQVSAVTKALDVDYTLAFDASGYLVITRVTTGSIALEDVMTVSFSYFNPAGVTATDIIGGYNASTGAYTGLEVIEQVFPRLRVVPGLFLAPKWSQTPSVFARMCTLAASVNGAFTSHVFADLSTSAYTIAVSDDAPAWKVDNNFANLHATVFWPKWRNSVSTTSGGVTTTTDYDYHLSTIYACIAQKVDDAHDDIPYASPSNQTITGTTGITDEEDEIFLTQTKANALNAQGICTMLNGFYGWRTWGNRTSIYPSNTDPKDAFIPLRRMFNYVKNVTVLTVNRDVDQPGNRRLIDGVLQTMGAFINGLIAVGALIDGLIEFRADENPTTDLSDGIYRFHYTLTPPSPAEAIEFTAEYDPDALAALFA